VLDSLVEVVKVAMFRWWDVFVEGFFYGVYGVR